MAGRGCRQDSWPRLTKDIPYHMVSCSARKPGKGARGAALAQGLTGHWTASGEQLHYASLALFILSFLLLLLYSLLLNCLYHSLQVLSLVNFLLHPTVGWGGVEQRVDGEEDRNE